jgi:carbon monoxide dehydrogenase subunit G
VTAVHARKPGTTRIQIEVHAPTSLVWEVLCDPARYPDFVPGAKYERDHDPEWPAPFTQLHHTIGWGPLSLRDVTKVEENVPGTSLTLIAGMSVLGTSAVRFTLEAVDDEHTRVGIEEWPVSGPIERTWNRLFDGLMTARNQELLRRFRDVTEEEALSPR